MPKKTSLEEKDPTSLLRFLRSCQTNVYSPLMHSARYTFLAMYGDRAAEIEARQYIDKAELEGRSNPILDKVKKTLNDRLKKQEWSDRVHPYLKHYNRQGVPFSDFSLDPAPISQIKKIINALYHAEEAFKRIEALDLDGIENTFPAVFMEFKGPITDHLYELCMLVTHPDVDWFSAFGPEAENVSSFMSQMYSKFFVLLQDANEFVSSEYDVDINNPVGMVHQAGELVGKGLAHLRPTNDLDYNTVSYFSANLSSYLNAMTQSIKDFAEKHLADASYQNKDERSLGQYQIDPNRVYELDQAAVSLASSFEGLFAGGMIQTLSMAKLPFMIRNVSTLVMSIIDEASNLRSGSEDLIRAFLAELKYKVMLEMLAAIDKIEEELMLRPGLLSKPMMNELASFYKTLYGFVDGVVDLSASGQDLVKLEESSFVEKRIQFCFERQAARELEQAKQEEQEQAIDAFFQLLLPHENKRLCELDDDLKKEVLKRFKVIRHDVEKVDLSLYNTIIRSLNPGAKDSQMWGQYLYERWFGYPDQISKICHREDLKHHLQKQKTTYDFQTKLNQDLISHVHKSLDTLLQHPHEIAQNALKVNESSAIKIKDAKKTFNNKKIQKDKGRLNLDVLTPDEALNLYQTYAVNHNKLIYAEQSLDQFMKQLEHDSPSTRLSGVHHRNRLRNLYTIFQPAMVTAMVEVAGDHAARDFDKAMIAALSGSDFNIKSPITIARMREVYEKTCGRISIEKDNAALRMTEINVVMKQKIVVADESIVLVPDDKNEVRAKYLVRKPRYEALMNNLQSRVDDLIKQLSPAMQQGLKIEEDKSLINALSGSSFELGIKLINKKMPNYLPQEVSVIKDKITPFNKVVSYFCKLESRAVPFPEVEDFSSFEYLKQPKQLIALKQLINCLHHLKESIIQIELLTDNQCKINYVWRVIMIEEHVRTTYDLICEIAKDPYFTPVIGELIESCQCVIETIKTFKNPHTPEKLNQDSNIETHDAVFFIVNSLMISTRQIDNLQENKTISEKSAREVQQFAEDYSVQVAGIIATSDSNLKIFLQLPTICALFIKIKNRWNNFAESTDNAVQLNLESINTEIFSDILMKADDWECKSLLEPGLISRPLKQLLDVYYQGLIHSLSNNAWHEVDLATSGVSFKKRLTHLEQKITDAKTEQTNCIGNKDTLNQFIQLCTRDPAAFKRMLIDPKNASIEMIDGYNALIKFLHDPSVLKKCQLVFNESAYPKSLEQETTELLAMSEIDKSNWMPLVDASSSEEQLNKIYQAFSNVANVCVAYHEGLIVSAQYALNSLLEQEQSIQGQRILQKDIDKKFEEAYIKKAIKKELKNHQSTAKNLLYGGQLYDDALVADLDKRTDAFIQTVSRSTELEEQVKIFVKNSVSLFDKDNFEEYKQYDELNKAVAELRAYIANQKNELVKLDKSVNKYTWAFENSETLNSKNELLKELESILNQKDSKINGKLVKHETIKERIEAFKNKVTSPIFENKLLQYQKYNISTFSWLVRWLINVLKVLKLYRSEAEIVHANFKKSAEKASQWLVNPGKVGGVFAAGKASSSEDDEDNENRPVIGPSGGS